MAPQCAGVVGACVFIFLSASWPAARGWMHPAGRRGAARLLAGVSAGAGLEAGPGAAAWEPEHPDSARGRRGSLGWRGTPGVGSLLLPPSPPSPPLPLRGEMEQQLANAVGGLGKRDAPSPAIFTVLGSVGVLTDLNSFFNTLQENLESMESLSPEERRAILSNPDDLHVFPQAGLGANRPLSSPALMYSLRNHRPSFKTRNFVDTGEPAALRRSNQHDPQLLWAGLGR